MNHFVLQTGQIPCYSERVTDISRGQIVIALKFEKGECHGIGQSSVKRAIVFQQSTILLEENAISSPESA